MFEIVFEDPETQQKQFVYQNSWGLSTRTIGAMVMIHGDDQGLVLPPRLACIQVVIIPCGITVNLGEAERKSLIAECQKFADRLAAVGVRVKLDDRDNYSPGWKFNHWELKGVPIRLELGPKDIKENQYVVVRRDNGNKSTLKNPTLETDIKNLLDTIHDSMYNRVKEEMDKHTIVTEDWKQFCTDLDKKNIIMSPFCGRVECEDLIKKESARDEPSEPGAPAMGAKTLCIPFRQPKEILPATKCIHPACNAKPQKYTLFGRSY
jgi:bifunctional glutamyl/prolyl-tRNA synthetase